jgi:hypothetical protein
MDQDRAGIILGPGRPMFIVHIGNIKRPTDMRNFLSISVQVSNVIRVRGKGEGFI